MCKIYTSNNMNTDNKDNPPNGPEIVDIHKDTSKQINIASVPVTTDISLLEEPPAPPSLTNLSATIDPTLRKSVLRSSIMRAILL